MRAYDLIANSSSNKRGVGFLFSRDIRYDVLGTVADPEENFLVIKVRIRNTVLILAAVYGPNVHNRQFFLSLYNAIKTMGNHPLVVGGDFNCTYSGEAVATNPDCYNMNDIPNLRHTLYLNEMCDVLNIIDPYRYLHPNKKEFSYNPFGTVRKNKSRIDYFLISRDLLCSDLLSFMSDSVQSTLFDHKAVFLSFGKKLQQKKQKRLTI
jgi:exonuclease III